MKVLFLIIFITLSSCAIVDAEFNSRIRGKVGCEILMPDNKIIINSTLDITVNDSIIYKYQKYILQNSAVYMELTTGEFVGIAINDSNILFISSVQKDPNNLEILFYPSIEQVDFSKMNAKWQLNE